MWGGSWSNFPTWPVKIENEWPAKRGSLELILISHVIHTPLNGNIVLFQKAVPTVPHTFELIYEISQ